MKGHRHIAVVVLTAVLACAVIALPAGAAPPSTRPAVPKGTIHTLPGGKRTYETLIPPAARRKGGKLPVVIYLHPSGDPKIDRARLDYWPILAGLKCMMVIPRSASRRMWKAGEERYVRDVIADVQVNYPVDPRRVCLLGVSGGGQVALFLADHLPEKFRAVIAVSTSPVVVRGRRAEWFYPNRKVLTKCPYLVVNHITQGSALMYWRQVRAKLAGTGASISILPVTGPVGHYLPPPGPLAGWLKEVLAGRHPRPLPDPQKLAVARMFAACVAALPKAIAAARADPAAKVITKTGGRFALSVAVPAGFERAGKEDVKDPTGRPMVQVRLEHEKWPIKVRCEARFTRKPMDEVLAADRTATVERGMLYQVYLERDIGTRRGSRKITVGSITYPDRRRGWVSALFIRAVLPHRRNPRRWMSVLIVDETQQPDASQLAAVLKTVVGSLAVRRPRPATTTAPVSE